MKKPLIFIVLIISLALCACDDIIKNDIKVVNNCGWSINVAITSSSATPSTYVAIPNGGNSKFTGFSDGTYYIHVRASPDSGATPEQKDWERVDMHIYKDDDWVISWSSSPSGFKILYTL